MQSTHTDAASNSFLFEEEDPPPLAADFTFQRGAAPLTHESNSIGVARGQKLSLTLTKITPRSHPPSLPSLLHAPPWFCTTHHTNSHAPPTKTSARRGHAPSLSPTAPMLCAMENMLPATMTAS